MKRNFKDHALHEEHDMILNVKTVILYTWKERKENSKLKLKNNYTLTPDNVSTKNKVGSVHDLQWENVKVRSIND